MIFKYVQQIANWRDVFYFWNFYSRHVDLKSFKSKFQDLRVFLPAAHAGEAHDWVVKRGKGTFGRRLLIVGFKKKVCQGMVQKFKRLHSAVLKSFVGTTGSQTEEELSGNSEKLLVTAKPRAHSILFLALKSDTSRHSPSHFEMNVLFSSAHPRLSCGKFFVFVCWPVHEGKYWTMGTTNILKSAESWFRLVSGSKRHTPKMWHMPGMVRRMCSGMASGWQRLFCGVPGHWALMQPTKERRGRLFRKENQNSSANVTCFKCINRWASTIFSWSASVG